MIIYSKQIKVAEKHLDQNNHVNNVQYASWVEMIAVEHWNILKHKTEYINDYWVLVDHHIQYKKQVYLGDTLIVKTYPEQPEGIKQPRKVEFYRGEELVVESRTLWVLINSETHKIMRVDKSWLDTLN